MASKSWAIGSRTVKCCYYVKVNPKNGQPYVSATRPGKTSLRVRVKGLPAGAIVQTATIQASISVASGSAYWFLNNRRGRTTVNLNTSNIKNGTVVGVPLEALAIQNSLYPVDPGKAVRHDAAVSVTGAFLNVTYREPETDKERKNADTRYNDKGKKTSVPWVGSGKTRVSPGRVSSMVQVYPTECKDFTYNGNVALKPSQCLVTEEDNGDFSVVLEHPMDEDGKWLWLDSRSILRMPCPARKSLAITTTLTAGGTTNRVEDLLIYTVTASRGYSILYNTKPKDDAEELKDIPLDIAETPGDKTRYTKKEEADEQKEILRVKNGQEVYFLASEYESGDSGPIWYMVSTKKGTIGWAPSTDFTRVAQETGKVLDVAKTQQRDQLFRIYEVEESTTDRKVTVRARHVFYDLAKAVCMLKGKLTRVNAARALQMLLYYADHAVPFRIYTNCTGTVTGDFRGKNLVSCLLDPETGMVAQLGAHLVRDNYDLYVIKNITTDRGVRIQHGRNLLGAVAKRSTDGMFNRIIAKIEDTYTIVNSPTRQAGDPWMAVFREYQEADGTAREQALKEFKEGLAAQDFSLEVDFTLLSDSPRYAQYNGLQTMYLGDECDISLPYALYTAEMSEYEWNAITGKYTKVTVGVTATQQLRGSIGSFEIRGISSGKLIGQLNGSQVGDTEIKTRHLKAGSVTTEKLEAASVTTDKLAANAVTAAKITAQAVTTEKLDAGAVTAAKIASSAVTADKLDAGSVTAAKMATDAFTAIYAGIAQAQIDWANISSLQSAVASIVSAAIGTADIDFAHVKDLVNDTAIITEGVGGELYIARLAVTEANMVSLTVGELLVKGSDGCFYSVSVDGQGNIVTTQKEINNADVEDASIHGGQKLIEGSITADVLNAQDIFADSATIREMIAANIDVDTLFAREAVINKLNALDITGNDSIRLYIQSQDALNAVVRITEDGLEIGRSGDPMRFVATNRTLEVPAVKTEQMGIAQNMSTDTEWVWEASASGLALKYVGDNS